MNQEFPKFKDLKFQHEIGGVMDDDQNNKIYPCEVGEYTIFHLKGGQGKSKISLYIMRKGKKLIIDLMEKESFLDKLAELRYTLEWADDQKKDVVIKHNPKGLIRRITDLIT